MYANHPMYAGQYASNPSNNPFVGDPTTAHARFPDISASTFNQPGYPSNGYSNQPQPQPQYQPYPPQSYPPGASYQPQPQMMSPHSQNQFSPGPTSYPGASYPAQGQMGPQPTGIAFQPTNGFPQQYPIPNGYPYSPGGGFPSTQANNASPGYLAEFDPYAQRAQMQSQSPSPSQSQISQTGSSSVGPGGIAHPRDLIRTHKSGLEAWDTYSWRQLLNGCDALKGAWSARKQQAESIVRQYGGITEPGLFGPDPAFGYNSQVEGWKQVLKDANNNFDTVAASTFQLHEVFNSYRHSGDQASKRRVRESCNAAVKGLPDWPSN